MNISNNTPHPSGSALHAGASSPVAGTRLAQLDTQAVNDLSAELDAWIAQASVGGYHAGEQMQADQLVERFGPLYLVFNAPSPAQQAQLDTTLSKEMQAAIEQFNGTFTNCFAGVSAANPSPPPVQAAHVDGQPHVGDPPPPTQSSGNVYERLAAIATLMILTEQENAKSGQELSNLNTQLAMDQHESAAVQHENAANATYQGAMLKGGMSIGMGVADLAGGVATAKTAGLKASQEAELSTLTPLNGQNAQIRKTELQQAIGKSTETIELRNAVKGAVVNMMKATSEIGGGNYDYQAGLHNASAERANAQATWFEDLGRRNDEAIRSARKGADSEVNLLDQVLSSYAQAIKGVYHNL